MGVAVEVRGVSKKYYLRHERMRSFQQVTIDFLTRRRQEVEEFWALRDVSFTIAPGETFGIIGSNGSGKSTLLKLIAKIVNPTAGSIRARGRVSALIELGAGFHPELTGRENVYLHGSFLGLGRKQMDKRYQQIVDFAEIEHFMDTPLKHYSSGMMMRLGFATAISVDADVLIIDEVLAVGDIRFQRKCLDALETFRRGGGTILLVAQDVGTIRRFCNRALLLSHGQMVACGNPADVIDQYVYGAETVPEDEVIGEATHAGNAAGSPQIFTATVGNPDDALAEVTSTPIQLAAPGVYIRGVRTINQDGQPTNRFVSNDPVLIEVTYQLDRSFDPILPGLQILYENEIYLHGSGARDFWAPCEAGVHRLLIEIPPDVFVAGKFWYSIGLTEVRADSRTRQLAYRNRLDSFNILPATLEEGFVRVPTAWSVVQAESLAEEPVAPGVSAP